MPTYAGRYYDVRPKGQSFWWSAYASDGVRSIGRGDTATAAAARDAAQQRIASDIFKLGAAITQRPVAEDQP